MLKLILIQILTVLAVTAQAQTSLDQQIKPFTSDGCSSAPDGMWGKSFVHCCIDHDFAYWIGGSEAQRSYADNELKACVQDALQEAGLVSTIYKAGVVVGGAPRFLKSLNSPFYWRWGYGWGENMGYRRLSSSQLKSALEELKGMDLNFKEIINSQGKDTVQNYRFKDLEISQTQFSWIQILIRLKMRDIQFDLDKAEGQPSH